MAGETHSSPEDNESTWYDHSKERESMTTSIVVTSKNDNYGGHLALRASYAIGTMLKNYEEVVYVDWCSDGPSLADELTIDRTGRLKHIRVTREDLLNIDPSLIELPIVEVLGRNIGIARASSDWIVSSNIDIMPTRLDTRTLDKNKIYAVSRRNVPIEFTLNAIESFDEFLVSSKNLFQQAPRINGEWAGRKDPWSLTVCCGDFQIAHRDLWEKMRGFEESMIYRDCADTNIMKKGCIYGDGAELIDLDVFHLDHDGHYLSVGGVSIKNSWEDFVENFSETANSHAWGLADYEFWEEQI